MHVVTKYSNYVNILIITLKEMSNLGYCQYRLQKPL
jgi:hypothetical protein